MTIRKTEFGVLDGRTVDCFALTNGHGLEAKIITFGARLVSMMVPDKSGTVADVALGFDDLASYVATDHFFGATCGRYGNRICQGQFDLDGVSYQVGTNEAGNHLHGGYKGFDKYIWDAVVDEDANSLTFTHISPNGDEGFPGEMIVKTTYTLTDDDRLVIAMSGMTTKTTIINMVHHTFWNLAGHASGTILDHHLHIASDFYTPAGEGLLATGEIFSVAESPFDFRVAKPIGRDNDAVQNSGVGDLTGGGYDHNWVLRGLGSGLRDIATISDPKSGRKLILKSTEPGVHVYVGGYINEKMIGKGNAPYAAYAGVTFETQKFPDAPNFAHFPSARLEPTEVYEHIMELQFSNS